MHELLHLGGRFCMIISLAVVFDWMLAPCCSLSSVSNLCVDCLCHFILKYLTVVCHKKYMFMIRWHWQGKRRKNMLILSPLLVSIIVSSCDMPHHCFIIIVTRPNRQCAWWKICPVARFNNEKATCPGTPWHDCIISLKLLLHWTSTYCMEMQIISSYCTSVPLYINCCGNDVKN